MLKTLINRLKKKGFRDAYVKSHLTHGLAHQVRALRIQRGLTQKDLADKLGLKTQSAVARMEDPSYGKLSIVTLLKLSSVFDVALSVRFVSYKNFLSEREDLSPVALCAESFEDEAPKIVDAIEQYSHYNAISMSSSVLKESYQPPVQIRGQATNYRNVRTGDI